MLNHLLQVSIVYRPTLFYTLHSRDLFSLIPKPICSLGMSFGLPITFAVGIGMKRPRSRSWEPQPQLTPSTKRGNVSDRPGTRHQRSQTAGSSFSRPRKQREQFRSALVKLILYVMHILYMYMYIEMFTFWHAAMELEWMRRKRRDRKGLSLLKKEPLLLPVLRWNFWYTATLDNMVLGLIHMRIYKCVTTRALNYSCFSLLTHLLCSALTCSCWK